MSKRVVLAGGGTAGHLFPSWAVAQRLREVSDKVQVLLIGAYAPLDEQLLPQAGLPYRFIAARPFPYAVSLRAIASLYRLVAATVAARRILRDFQPTAIFGAGGYVAAPVVAAGRLLRIATVVHVCDAYPDRASRLLSRWATAITVTFAEVAEYLPSPKVVHTGGPLRRQIVHATALQGRELLGLDADRFTVLVMGGSQGAQRVNEGLVAALPTLLEESGLQIVHLTGQRHHEKVRQQVHAIGGRPPAYQCHAYLEQMGPALAAADLVVSRAGSSSIAEATARGKPLILVPYPYAGGHQKYNAAAVTRIGAAEVIDNDRAIGAVLGEAILKLYRDEPRRQAMAEASQKWGRTDAAERIAELLLSY